MYVKRFHSILVYNLKMNSFAKNLAALMQENGISQNLLAKTLKVKQQTISRYIKGDREPDINIIIEIAQFFDVTVGQLLGVEEY